MTLDEQIIATLKEAATTEEGATATLFAFYAQLLTRLDAHKATLTLTLPPLLRREPPDERRRAGRPYLSWDHLPLAAAPFYEWLRAVAHLFDQRDPGTLDELEATVAPEHALALARAWYEQGTTTLGPTVDALVANALAPYLERAAEILLPQLPLDLWEQCYCPLCGGWPDFALWQEGADSRDLLCERCRTLWAAPGEGCAFCGESDPTQYGYYSSEDELHLLFVCDHCGHYLKAINQQQAHRARLRPILAAERLLTPGLDLLAAEMGYQRPVILARAST